MCGLVGVAGTLTENDKKTFHQLLWIDAIRGGDGTGMFAVKHGKVNSTWLVKESGTPDRLFDKRKYWDALNTDRMVMMGHNRAGTVGKHTYKNAHPFEFDHITGAHNGTLNAFSQRKLLDHQYFETDSEAIFNMIEEKGVENVIPLLEGAWALTWWDNRDHSINFLRNKERTLYYCTDVSRTTLFWASEVAMLYLALNHNNVPFSAKDVHIVAENQHYKFVIPLQSGGAISKPTKVERKGFFTATPHTMGTCFPRGGSQMTTSSTASRSEFITSRLNEHSGIVTEIVRDPVTGIVTTKSYPREDRSVIITPNTPLTPDEVARRELRREEAEAAFKDEITGNHPPVKLSRLIKPMRHFKGTKGPYYVGYNATDVLYQADWDKFVGQGCANCGTLPQWGEPIKPLKDGTLLCADCVINNPEDILLACSGLL